MSTPCLNTPCSTFENNSQEELDHFPEHVEQIDIPPNSNRSRARTFQSRMMSSVAGFRRRKQPDKLFRLSGGSAKQMGSSFSSSTEERGDSFDSAFDSIELPTTPTSKFFSSKSSTPSRSRLPSLNRSCDSTDSSNSSNGVDLAEAKANYRIMFLGSNKSGKTSIIRQFLYDKFSSNYKETMDDMYRGEFEIHHRTVGFDIQDVSGGYVYEFPGMLSVSLSSADAFVLVFALDSNESWEEVARLRDLIQTNKGIDVPIVVVGNKSDLEVDPAIPHESLEATVTFDWENGYVESSAKDRVNINQIFRELLLQAKSHYDFSLGPTIIPPNIPPALLNSSKIQKRIKDESLRRRQSLPAVPADIFEEELLDDESTKSTPDGSRKSSGIATGLSATLLAGGKSIKRRSSLAVLRRESCKIS